jgi:hypothetical protein
MPDAAIFADTQAEPQSVYRWLDWLETQLPFPVFRITKGDMTAEALRLRERVKSVGKPWSKSLLPVFTLEPDGKKGHMQRACTHDYKIDILRKAQRRLAAVKRGQKVCTVTTWIGISLDEVGRMKQSREPWVRHRYPLIDVGMSRQDCLNWMAKRGYPEPPRSACVYCPYHSNKEWRRLRDQEPAEFAKAVQFERDLQAVKRHSDNMRGIPFLHPARIPLDQVNLDEKEDPGMPQWNTMQNECAGICGV